MENAPKHDESLTKFSKRVIFNSRTFNSKLFLKLTTPFIAPSIICIQTLRYEQENRKLTEIEKAIPWLKTIPNLNKFINLKETDESSHKLLIELTWVLFYKYYRKNVIIKKAKENNEFFYILLGGKILKLNIVYERESLTLEEYLIYIIKMKFIHEKEILKQCKLLNSFYVNIDADNLNKFFKENPQFNYENLKEIAKQEIINLGFRIEDFQEEKIKIHSIDNYIKIANMTKHTKKLSEGFKATPKLYLGRYVKSGYVSTGQFIGNLSQELVSDNSTYICIDNCDIGLINKKTSKLNTLYKLIVEKKMRILTEIRNYFFLFNKITDKVFYNEIVPYFEYKQFHQGEKIFVQDSLYEGIYLIKQGEVNIYLNSAINDLGNYISNIKYSLCGFKEYISILNVRNNNNTKDEILVKPKIIDDKTQLTKEKCNILHETNKYDITTIPEYSIFGTNELYDNKTGLYYFSAECISEEAIIYFLPKKYFYSLLIKEKPISLALIETVESKVKFIIGKLKYHIKCFEAVINKKNKKFENNKLNPLNLNDFSNNNFISSLKILYRNNLSFDENKPIIKKNEKSFQFPLLVPLFKDSNKKHNNKKESNKKNNIFGQTITSFSFKDKSHRLIRNKTLYNNYKKINLRFHPATFNMFNKNTKSYEGKIALKEERKIHKKIKLNLPTNFPYNVQNTYYNSTFCSIKK